MVVAWRGLLLVASAAHAGCGSVFCGSTITASAPGAAPALNGAARRLRAAPALDGATRRLRGPYARGKKKGPPPHHVAAFVFIGVFVVSLVAYAARETTGACRRRPKVPVTPSAESLRATARAAVAEHATEVEMLTLTLPPSPERPGTAETAEIPATPGPRFVSHGECAICMELFASSPERVVRLGCGHLYHRDCIVRWLSSPTQSGLAPFLQCPLCKRVVTEPAPGSRAVAPE